MLLAGNAPPRVRHAPARVRSNAWEDISDLVGRYGLNLFAWQEAVFQDAMGERADGRWATPQIGVCVPRQNGKSELIVARALAGVLLFGERTIIVSAHQQDTAREVFQRIVDLCETHPDLDKRVATYGKAINREYIRFKSGQTIRFKARSKGGGRGFTCDCLLLDEAQILPDRAWAAIRPTLSARPNTQVWLLGTPPTLLDESDVFDRFRSAGLAGKDKRLVWLEWSPRPDADADDVATWAETNPSFPFLISEEAIRDERTSMSDEQFWQERLGRWLSDAPKRVDVFNGAWGDRLDAASEMVSWRSVAVAIAPDGATASVAVCGPRADGDWHVEVKHGRDFRWVVGEVIAMRERGRDIRGPVTLSGRLARVVDEDLRQADFEVLTMTAGDVMAADALFAASVEGTGEVAADVWHRGQDELNAAVHGARWKDSVDGRVIDRRGVADVTPLKAAAAARWAAARVVGAESDYDVELSVW